MTYYQYRIQSQHTHPEILLAFLNQMAFESFQEKEDHLEAYLPSSQWSVAFEQELKALSEQLHFSFQKAELPDQNWNAIWESNFQAIIVEDFCGIRADFHPPITQTTYEIVINPRMAFGTGHHETTYMMMATMKELPIKGRKVLDYGCGTGILAILAAKMGASEIQANDIEKAAYENTLVNIQSNQTEHIQVFEGDLHVISAAEFDLILANINRNVLLDSLESLYQKLKTGAILLISGFIEEDEDQLIRQGQALGLRCIGRKSRNNWRCLTFNRL
ncbi:MAG: 50S ribosomal protein L11 methyltransferase [Bacteroidota bacterium]